MRYFLLLSLLYLVSFAAYPQTITPPQPATKAADSVAVKIKVPTIIHNTNPETTDENGSLILSPLDTTLDEIRNVDPTIKYFYNNLGNNGSASDNQYFLLRTSPLTHLGNYSFDLYKWKPEDIHYYKTNKKYSDLAYHQNAGHEQVVKISLTENVVKNWNIGIDFHRLGTQGFLQLGSTFHSNFDAYTWYHTPDNRYNLFASAVWNTVSNKVNGGVTNDSTINNNSLSNSELEGVRVHLTNATQKITNHIFSFSHFYDLGKNDTTIGKKIPQDSILQNTSHHHGVFRIRHDAMLETYSYGYAETTDSSTFQNFYFNDSTTDSLYYTDFKNKISLTHFIDLGNASFIKNINYGVAGGYQFFQYHLFTDSATIHTLTKYDNTFAEGQITVYSKNNKLKLHGDAQYVVKGDNEKNYTYNASARLSLFNLVFIEGSGQQLSHSPSVMEKFYVSNHYLWWNNFKNTDATILKGRLEIPKYHFEMGAQYSSISNYIFLNFNSLPSQNLQTMRVTQAYITKNFHFHKIRLNNTVYWQQVTNEAILHLPQYLSHNALYFEGGFFKNKLLTQIGFDMHYTSGYYANAYNPALSVFYLQDSVKTNNYPLLDFFFTFRIKTARVFLKMQNLLDEVYAANYYLTPHYPMPGRFFQIGIDWKFFD